MNTENNAEIIGTVTVNKDRNKIVSYVSEHKKQIGIGVAVAAVLGGIGAVLYAIHDATEDAYFDDDIIDVDSTDGNGNEEVIVEDSVSTEE